MGSVIEFAEEGGKRMILDIAVEGKEFKKRRLIVFVKHAIQ